MNDDERRAFIAGLREAADFFESNPGLAIYMGGQAFCSFPDSREAFLAECKTLGSFKKEWDNQHVTAKKRFTGGHTLKVFGSRGEFCTRVVTRFAVPATEEYTVSSVPAHEDEKVTWECPEDFSLLGEAK